MKKVFILSLVMALISTLAFSQVVSRQNPKGPVKSQLTTVQQGTVSTTPGYVAPGNFRLLGDDCTDPFMVGTLPVTETGTAIESFNGDYSLTLVTPYGYEGADVVYAFTAAADFNLSVTISSDWDQALTVFTDCADVFNSQDSLVATDANWAVPFTETMVLPVVTGTTYYIVAVAYEATATGAWTIVFEEAVACTDNLVLVGDSEIEPNGGINSDPIEYDPRNVGTEAAPTQVNGSLETVGGQRDMDWFNISLTQGDDLHVTADIVCGDVTIFIVNETGSYYEYAENNGPEMGEELVFNCDTTGNYWIIISPPDFVDRPLFTYNVEIWEGEVVVNPADGESFEGSFPPAGWSIIDNDGDGENWEKMELTAQEGSNVAASASFINNVGPLTPDNWLITYQIENVDAGQVISWWVAGQDPSYAADKYAVMISTATDAISDFTITLHEETIPADVFVQHEYDMSSYEGQSIYVAFRHYDCTDMYIMKLDDVVLPEEGTASIDPASIRVYNILGVVVASIENASDFNTINLSDFANGTYIVKVTSEGNVYNKKIVVNR